VSIPEAAAAHAFLTQQSSRDGSRMTEAKVQRSWDLNTRPPTSALDSFITLIGYYFTTALS
jgi:hypothetical protein